MGEERRDDPLVTDAEFEVVRGADPPPQPTPDGRWRLMDDLDNLIPFAIVLAIGLVVWAFRGILTDFGEWVVTGFGLLR